MKAQSKKIKNLTSWMALILITVIISVCGYFKTQEIKQIAKLPLELRKALEYGELQEEDYKTQSEGVEFSVFFPRDLDGDGYAERTKGTAVPLGDEKRELYAELNISKNGYLESGEIILNCDNMYWSTTLIADNIVANNCVGQTNYIKLQDKVNSGSQKMFIGTISPKIGNNINDYSKINSMTLKGTYVDEEGHRTTIDVTRKVKIDWYGYVNTVINSNEQTLDRVIADDVMYVKVKLSSSEEYKNLILKENVMTAKAPELNGYKAIGVVGPNGVQCDFDKESGVVTITNSNEVDEDGNITKQVRSVNNYEIKFIYPVDARGYIDEDDSSSYIKIEVPITAKYVAYNNQSEGFSNIVESEDNDIINIIKEKHSEGIYRVADVVVGGESYHSRRVISKEKALNYYKGIEEEDPDEYIVRWRFDSEKDFNNLVVKEEKADETLNKNGITTSLKDVVSYKGIYFDNGFQTTDIKVYDDDTNELLCSFDKATDAPRANAFMYDRQVKHVRVEVGNIKSHMSLTICHIKEIDDKAMTETFSKGQFDNIKGIYSYLHATDNDMNKLKSSTFAGFAEYNEIESEVKMDLSNVEVNNNNELTPQTITIRTVADDYNQIEWKNGEFLVKFPKNIIYANIESVNISDPSVEILGYDLFKKDGVYFAKVITANAERKLYNLNINCNILINPITPTTNDKFILYAYNEDCHKYYLDIDDTYDVNGNNDVTEKVGTYSVYMKMNSPSTLLTSQSASNYDDEGSVTIAPNIADVNQDKRTVDISVNILNNYEKTIDEIKVLGTIPFEGNKYIRNSDDLGSEFSSYMTNSGIRVTDSLKGKVTIYYSENPEATKDLDDENNGWTTTPEDFSKVRRYLIDFGSNLLPSGNNGVFTYTVEIPKGIEYNRFSYSTHMLYFAMETAGGKLLTQVESSRLGIRMARKYNLDIDKFNSENHKPVAGAVYKLVELDENNEEFSSKLVTTNSEGKLIVKDLYVDRKYTLEEIKNPSNYMLNTQKLEFITRENANYELEIEVLSEDKFKTGPTIETNTVNASVEDEPRYKVVLTKKDSSTEEKLAGVQFDLAPVNEKYITDKEGQLVLNNLERNVEYTLKETYADGYYLLDEIKFKLVKENDEFKIISDNNDFANAEITVENNEDLIKVELDIDNNRQPSILINKIDKDTNEPIQGVRFNVEGRIGKNYVTDAEGKVLINGFAENQEYTIKETKADGHYLQNITFTIVKDAQNKLKINSENEEFKNAVVIDETRKILSVTLPNEKIPTYKLRIQKIDGDTKKALKDAKFQLVGQDNDTVKEYVTDENGVIEVPNLYKYVEGKYITGNYILKELEAPNGYSNNAENIEFKVVKVSNEESTVEIENLENLKTVADAKIENDILTLTIKDKPLFTLLKVDSETKVPLANAKFVIMRIGTPIDYAKDVNGNYIGTQDEDGKYIITTDELGRITLALPNGKYMLMEVDFPEGYKEKDIVQYIEINDGTTGNDEEISDNESEDEIDNIEYIETINTIEDLVSFAKQVNSGVNYNGHKVTLARTLDFTEDSSYNNPEDNSFGDLNKDGVTEGIKEELSKGIGFTPIGNGYDSIFSGTFEGNGNQIKNIYCNLQNQNQGNVGLFGYCKNAIILNLGVSGNINTNIEWQNIGGIVNRLDGSIILNCYSNVSINSSSKYDSGIGGIVGNSNSSLIENCYNIANINGNAVDDKELYIGGIVGEINATKVLNCYNIGNLNSNKNVGAIVGKVNEYSSKSIVENNYYLNGIEIIGNTEEELGIAKTEEEMKADEFIEVLNSEAYTKDVDNVNNGYPVLLKAQIKPITEIEYIEDLVELSDQVSYGNSYTNVEITLKRTLDFTDDDSYKNPESTVFGDLNGDGTIEGIKEELSKGNGFSPIGENYDSRFSGIFNGNNKEIKNIYINNNSAAGLFGYIEGATIKDISVTGNISGEYVGGIAGYAVEGDIVFSNCHNYAKLNATSNLGGILGYGYNVGSVIENCSNEGEITETSSFTKGGLIGYYDSNENSKLIIKDSFNKANIFSGSDIGGLIGYCYNNSNASVIIDNCYNEGNVEGGTSYTAGLIGYNSGGNIAIKNSYNKGNISGYSSYYVGGLGACIYGETEVDNCYNVGNVQVSENSGYVSGIIGYAGSNIKINNCHNKGKITYENENSYGNIRFGGILGYSQNQIEITNCSNSGNIIVKKASYIGGITSYVYNSNSILTNNYNTGNITVEKYCEYVGGIAGYTQYDTKIENSYNTGDITLNNGGYYVGGIVGYGAKLNNIYNTGNILVKSDNSSTYTGGISGYNSYLIKNGYNTGNVTVFLGNSYGYAGGITGYPSGELENLYNTGDVSILKSPNVSNSGSSSYLGGIVGMNNYGIKNVYNSGKVTTTAPFSSQLCIGGISGWDSSTVENAYNTGDIEANWNEFVDGSMYIGGINGYNSGLVKDSINTGKIKYNMEGAQSSSEYRNVGGIAAGGSAENCYSAGNIELIDKSSNLKYGKILGTSTDSEAINYYSKDMMTSVNSSSYFSVIKTTNEQVADEIPLSRILDIKSVDFYNLINEDSVWTRLEGYLPKLLVGGAKNIDATQIEIENTLKTFNITTDIDESDGKKGGTITGEDEIPFENVKYGEQNTKEIKMVPSNGYEISSITINGEQIAFEVDADKSYTILPGAFINIKEDKHIVVKYSLAEQVLTINKVDADNNNKKLSGAKFTVEKLKDNNELLGKMTANGTYYFEEFNGTYMPNNIQVGENANSYVPIDLTNVSGEYYVVVNAEGYSGSILGTISENTDIITNLSPYSTNAFMYVSGGSIQPQDYTSNLLQGGNKYYLKLASTPWSPGAPSANRINSIRLFKKAEDASACLGEVTSNNENRTFINDNGIIKLDGVNTNSQGANAYIEIDLTNKTGLYNVLANLNTKISGGSYFAATIQDSTAAVSDYSPYNKYVYLDSDTENRTYVTKPLEGGKKYYLQLSYTGGNPINEININSIILAKSSVVEWFVNNDEGIENTTEENEIFGKMFKNTSNTSYYTFEENDGKYVSVAQNTSTACIEIDLTNKTGNYNALVDFSKSNTNGTFIAKIAKGSGLETDYSPYGKFIYVSDTENGKTYSSPILKGGEKYYLHLISTGGAGAKGIVINNINLVENTAVETFNNSNSNEIFGSLTQNGDYYFEYNNGKLIPNNNNEETELANSYIPINLNNKTGKYAVVIRAKSDNSIAASISKNTDPIENISYFSNNSFMWVNGAAADYGVYPEYTYVSEPIDGGEEYYLKLVSESRKNDKFSEITDIQIVEYSRS